jgi:hypothetical protein
MKRHPLDVLALLFGLAFAISGVIVVLTQSTSVDVSPQWGAAVGLIVLGVVALAATIARTDDRRVRPAAAHDPASPVSAEDPTD